MNSICFYDLLLHHSFFSSNRPQAANHRAVCCPRHRIQEKHLSNIYGEALDPATPFFDASRSLTDRKLDRRGMTHAPRRAGDCDR